MSWRSSLCAAFLLAAVHGRTAPPDKAGFLREKGDILAVTVERVRQVPDDAGRAVKAGENNLRALHENYRLARSTPPTTMDGDVRDLTAAANAMRLARSRGRTPSSDERAQEAIERRWETYRSRVDSLLDDIRYKRDAGQSEGTVYWQAIKDQEDLASGLAQGLAYNAPPGQRTVEEAVAVDRRELLKRLEDPARVRGRLACIKSPDETALPPAFDAGPFYRATALLPGTNPLRQESFELPPGCRTVTLREPGVRLILRATRGHGRVLVGTEEHPLAYEYLIVPPEVPYLIENTGTDSLRVDLIALAP